MKYAVYDAILTANNSFNNYHRLFKMNIISGSARNLALAELPDSAIRPTAIRARKALFDSIGSFENCGVLDLCSGSGALALESASRGAAWIAMVEKDSAHIGCIRENCRRVNAAGCTSEMVILEFDILNFSRYKNQLPAVPDMIFADPPYAISAELFSTLLSDKDFCSYCRGSKLFWEIPDMPGEAGKFIQTASLGNMQLRRFGGTMFIIGTIKG